MRCLSIVFALATAACCNAAQLRGQVASLELEESGEWAALYEAESEDRQFLFSQLDQTEAALVKLQQFSAAPTDKKAAPAVKEAAVKTAAPAVKEAAVKTAAPVVKAAVTEAKKDVAPAVKKDAKPQVAAKADAKDVKKVTTSTDAAKKEEDPASVMASLHLKLPSAKGLMGKAALAPMLAMLKGMYADTKERITQQNTREEKSKKWFTQKEAEHKAKLASIEGKFKNHTLSEEFRTNETRDESRYFNYWSRCRERQHRQFHTNLKIQHGMMMKVKKMIGTYENALSTKPSDQQAAKRQLGQMTGMPEIVFIQEVQRTVGSFCHDSLAEVRKEREEMQQWAKEGMKY